MKRLSVFLILLLFLLGIISVRASYNTVRSRVKSLAARGQKDAVWTSVEKKLTLTPPSYSLHESSSFPPTAHAANEYDNATSYVAVDFQNGNVLAQKNENTPVPIASLTKLMSAVVALDLAKATDDITVPYDLSSISPTKIDVAQGERMSLQHFLEAMLMTSANDSAQAVHDGINQKYGEDIFVWAMNEKAKFLELTNTHFSNPQGFDGNNYSSAHDLAILTQYALTNYPAIAQIVSQDYTHIDPTSAHKQYDLYNWNGLLDVYPGVSGVKIGNTDEAGYTTIVTSTRNGHEVLAVVLGAPGVLQRDSWTAALLDDVFSQNYGLPPVNVTTSALQSKYATWHYWN